MAESQTVKDFFETLPARVPPEKTAGMTNSYVFAIADAGSWLVTVVDGAVTVTAGEGEADARISMSEETARKLASGEQSATRAVLTGKIRVEGDMGAARKLQKLFG